MKLPKVGQNKTYEIGQLIKILLQIHKDSYVDINDIDVEYYDCWDFYKVSVFRWSKCSSGCGTKDSRDKLWEKHKTDISELFDMKMKPNESWRWKNYSCYNGVDIETEENGSVTGITYYIQCE